MAIAAIWFGLFLMNIDVPPDAGGGVKTLRIVFAIVWFTFWIVAVLHNAMTLWARPRPATTEVPPPAGGEVPADFEARLRKLEALKKDGLLSEDEYRKKRKEIMREKW
jgi:hypothetical protein